jgi:hypothetical protein
MTSFFNQRLFSLSCVGSAITEPRVILKYDSLADEIPTNRFARRLASHWRGRSPAQHVREPARLFSTSNRPY